MKTAVVVLAEGFEEIEAVTPIDMLRRADVRVTVAGVGGTTIRGSHGLAFECDARLESVDEIPDLIVLPGGLPGSENLGNSHEVRALTQKVHDNGGICAAICAAPALTLARFGLLDDRTATCYPSFEKHFDESTTHSEERVVIDRGIVTSRGAGTSMEFALSLVAQLAGEARAEELRKGVLA
jgi:4-methyl-5(b-hydroxyethyl)-thiazole monophosphate biosynthesis